MVDCVFVDLACLRKPLQDFSHKFNDVVVLVSGPFRSLDSRLFRHDWRKGRIEFLRFCGG